MAEIERIRLGVVGLNFGRHMVGEFATGDGALRVIEAMCAADMGNGIADVLPL